MSKLFHIRWSSDYRTSLVFKLQRAVCQILNGTSIQAMIWIPPRKSLHFGHSLKSSEYHWPVAQLPVTQPVRLQAGPVVVLQNKSSTLTGSLFLFFDRYGPGQEVCSTLMEESSMQFDLNTDHVWNSMVKACQIIKWSKFWMASTIRT